jgi:hypothetical protein
MNDTTPVEPMVLSPIGPCAECGKEINYGAFYTIMSDQKRRHTSCAGKQHWAVGGTDYENDTDA